MLEKELHALGLNENEQKVYLMVLSAGKVAPSRISKETGINRTTIYSISRKLMSLGLIGEDLGAKIAYLYAEEPRAIENLFLKEEERLKEKKILAKQVAGVLASLPRGSTYSVPKIKFVEEEDLTDYLYKAYTAWAASGVAHDNTWWGYHDSSFTENYQEWIEWSWKHGPENLKVRFLTNARDVEREVSGKFKERRLTFIEGTEFDSSLWVIGDFVLMAQSRQHPHYLVEINDPVFARNQRELFKAFWEKSK